MLLLSCTCTGDVPLFSQHIINCRQYTTDEGLSQNIVYCMLQDKRGFIWAGTDNGLNRFDGYSFKKFFKNNRDTISLSNNAVLSLAEGPDGRIWIGTMEGLNVYDPGIGRVKRIKMPDENIRSITDMLIRDNGDMFISSGGSLYLFNTENNQLENISKRFQVDAWERFLKLPGGRIAIAAFRQIKWQLLARDDNDPDWKLVTFKQAGLPAKDMLHFYGSDRSGNQYLCTDNDAKIHVLDGSGKQKLLFDSWIKPVPDGFKIYTVCEAEKGKTWIATSRGLYIYDHAENKISHAELRTSQHTVPPDIQLRSILADRDGNTWLGCFPGGMLQCDTRSSPFGHSVFPGTNGQRSGMLVMNMQKWKGGIVTRLAGTAYVFRNGKLSEIKRVGDTGFHPDSLNSFGTLKFSFTVQQQKIIDILRKELPQNSIAYSFFPIGDSLLVWHNGFNDLYLYSPVSRRGIYKSVVLLDFHVSDRYYWLATSKGLIRLDRRQWNDTLYRFDPGNPNSLSESWLYCVEQIGDELWIGTKGGGLNRLRLRENKFYHYTTEDGLPDNAVYTVVPDGLGNLWLSTNNGLSRFTPATGSVVNFSRRDGLLNSEFNRRSGVMGEDGFLYFGGLDGIDFFRPEDIIIDSTRPVVYVSQVMVNGKERHLAAGTRLKHSANNLTLFFTTNDFIRPDLVYFRYRLKERDPWSLVRGTNSISLNALSHGRYRFEIQASNNNHIWGNSTLSAFTISIPWWRSVWLYAGMAFIALAVLYMLYRYRIRHYQKLLAIRSRISKDLHDEVGATLSSIHIYSTVASKTLETDAKKSREALKHIHENSKQVMENLNDIVWAVKGRTKDEYSLEEKLKNYGYELLTPQNIRCEYEVDKEVEKMISGMEARRNILLIAKEAMNNIAKYSGASLARVSIRVRGKNLELEVSDNGKGMDITGCRRGNGLQHMQERGNTLGGILKIHSAPGGGTTVVCCFPMTSISDS